MDGFRTLPRRQRLTSSRPRFTHFLHRCITIVRLQPPILPYLSSTTSRHQSMPFYYSCLNTVHPEILEYHCFHLLNVVVSWKCFKRLVV